MSQRSYTGAGTLILGGLALLAGCKTLTPAEQFAADRKRFEDQGYFLVSKTEHDDLTDPAKMASRLEAAVDARLKVLTGAVDTQGAATSLSFYQRMEESRRRAEMAVVEARTFQTRTGTQFSELRRETLDPIQTYGESIRGLRARMGEFQVALDVQAQIMDGIWRRYETFCTFYVARVDALRTGLEANYTETQTMMRNAELPLAQRIEQWKAQAQARSALRNRTLDQINAQAEADMTQSRADVDNLLRALATQPQRP